MVDIPQAPSIPNVPGPNGLPVPPNPTPGFSAGFSAGPPVASICGFNLPKLFLKLGIPLPAIEFPPKLPIPKIAIGLNCNLQNPLSVSVTVSRGGGRVPNALPDPDLDDSTP
jgi:hypothetical protein